MSGFPRGQLHVLTDPGTMTHWEQWARAVAKAGATVLQYRDKRATHLEDRARGLGDLQRGLHGSATRLIVNDSVPLALEAGADGVHLGATDSPVSEAREKLGTNRWIGRTANSLQEALQCDAMGADYLGVGPFRQTRSKANPAAPLGIEGLAQIVSAVHTPVIAIGGIEYEDLADLFSLPLHGVAVIGAIQREPDPAQATGRFRERIDRWVSVDG